MHLYSVDLTLPVRLQVLQSWKTISEGAVAWSQWILRLYVASYLPVRIYYADACAAIHYAVCPVFVAAILFSLKNISLTFLAVISIKMLKINTNKQNIETCVDNSDCLHKHTVCMCECARARACVCCVHKKWEKEYRNKQQAAFIKASGHALLALVTNYVSYHYKV